MREDENASNYWSKKIRNEFLASQNIEGLNYVKVKCFECCCQRKNHNQHTKMLNKSQSRLEKEMDL